MSKALIILRTAAVAAVFAIAPRVHAACVGDCNGSVTVTVDELVVGVNIALGQANPENCTAMDRDAGGTVTVDELVAAVNNALVGCPTEPTATPTSTPEPTPTGGDEGLGVRRFSINSENSFFSIEGLPLPLRSQSVEGYLELEAGPLDAETGLRKIRITGASDFISIWLVPPIGMPSAICVKPVIDSFPSEDVGDLACEGDDREGVILTQDHNVNDVDPECTEGLEDVNPAHDGVCNAEIRNEIILGDSGPGGLAIAPDPVTLEGGLRMETFVETALPCGDEPDTSQGIEPWVLTTGLSRAVIVDRDNIAEATVEAEDHGDNFDCDTWTVEDGPGTLAFVAPVIDQDLPGLGYIDVIFKFIFQD